MIVPIALNLNISISLRYLMCTLTNNNTLNLNVKRPVALKRGAFACGLTFHSMRYPVPASEFCLRYLSGRPANAYLLSPSLPNLPASVDFSIDTATNWHDYIPCFTLPRCAPSRRQFFSRATCDTTLRPRFSPAPLASGRQL